MSDGRPWFRLYKRMTRDPAVRRLSDPAFRVLLHLWCESCDGDPLWSVQVGGSRGFRPRDLLSDSGVRLPPTDARWQKVVQELTEKPLVRIENQPDGGAILVMAGMDELQFTTDSSTERSRKHREAQRGATPRDGLRGNEGATVPETESETDTEKKNKRSSDKARPSSPSKTEIDRVFDHWRQATGHTGSKLDAKRSGKIKWALTNYNLDFAIRAIDGCVSTPWNRGENPDGKRYDALTLIFRDAEHIERYATQSRAPNGTTADPDVKLCAFPPCGKPVHDKSIDSSLGLMHQSCRAKWTPGS